MSMEPGAALGPWTLPSVSAEQMKAFARVLDDPNPIHLDPDAVQAMGLGDRVINQGPLNFGYVMTMLREAAPGAALRDFRVRLLGNVLAKDSVRAGGEVVSVEDADGERRATCRIWLDVEGGRRVLEGTATLALAAS